jgi:hypothetical protein
MVLLLAKPKPSTDANMAARTPSMVSTSSSRIAVGFAGDGVIATAATGSDDGASGGVSRGRGAIHAVVDLGDAACRFGNVVVINDRVPSAAALTFSIRNSYRHSGARLESFLVTDAVLVADFSCAVAP